MKPYLYTGLLLLLVITQGITQPAYQFAPENDQSLGNYFEYWAEAHLLEDPQAWLASEQKPVFTPLNHPVINFGFSKQAYWLRAKISNPSYETEESWVLYLDNGSLYEADLWVQNSEGAWTQHRNGFSVPIQEKGIPEGKIAFRIDLDPGETKQIYLRLKSNTYLLSRIKLNTESYYRALINTERWALGLFYGLLLGGLFGLAITYCFTLHTYLLYFIAGGFLLSIVTSGFDGLANEYLFKLVQLTKGYQDFYTGVLIPTFILLFARDFLRVFEFDSWHAHKIWGVLGLDALAMGFLAIDTIWAISLHNVMCVMAVYILLDWGLRSYRKGVRQAKFFVWGLGAFALMILFFFIPFLKFNSPGFIYSYGLHLGYLLFVLILTIGQAEDLIRRLRQVDHMNLEREKERQQLIAQKNQELEVEVKNVTQKILSQEAKLSSILSSSDDLIISLNQAFKIKAINEAAQDAFRKMYGTHIEAGHILIDYLPQEEKAYWSDIFNLVLSGNSQRIVKEYTREEALFIFDLTLNPVRLDGQHVSGITVIAKDIRAAKLREEQLELLSTVARESSHMIYIVDSDDRVVWVNRSFESTYGATLEDIQLKVVHDLHIGPETDPMTLESIREAIREGKSFQGELLKYTENKQKIWVSLQLNPVIDQQGQLLKFVGIENDITERKKHLHAISEKESHLHAIIHNNTDPICLLDTQGKVDLYNKTFEEISLILLEKPITPGITFLDNLKQEYHVEQWDEAIQQALDGHIHQCILTLDTANKQRIFDFRSYPVHHDQDIFGIVFHARDITALEESTHALKISQERFELAMQGSHEGIWDWRLDTNEVYYSPGWKRQLGYEPEELPNKQETFINLMHPEDRVQMAQHVKEYISGQSDFYEQELRLRHKDGEWRWIRTRGFVLKNKHNIPYRMVGSHSDITDSKQYQLEIMQKEANLRSIIDNNTDANYLLNEEGLLIAYNLAFEKIWKRHSKRKLTIGTPMVHNEVQPSFYDMWMRRFKNAISGGSKRFLTTLAYKNDVKIYETTLSPILRFEQVTGVAVVTRDVTDQRRAEEELRKAKDRAEEATRAKSQFLSTMSHEMRTPLNAVIGLANFLLMENPRPDQVENLNTLLFSASNLLALINDILDFNKLEANKVELENVLFNFKEVIQEIKKSFKPQAQDKSIYLRFLYEDGIPNFLYGDPKRLAQILNNLISNAIKFTHEGGVYVTIEVEKDETEAVDIKFIIQDTGIGIPEEKQKMIFEQFSQASEDTTRRFGGTGLGLSITTRLLELMGSQIILESQMGEGASFSFTIRLKRPAEPPKKPQNSENVLLDSYDLEGKKILFVEDNPINQFMARKYLEKWKLKIEYAENGREAVAKVIDCPEEAFYDLILMDLHMPEMDGYEASRLIRMMEKEPAQLVPILALSAANLQDVEQKLKESGINDFLGKPFRPEDLYKKMNNFLNPEKETPVLHGPSNGQANDQGPRPDIQLDKIYQLADGDVEYQSELISLYIKFLEEFKQEFTQALENRDISLLKAIAHKAKPTVAFLELKNLEQTIEEAKTVLAKSDPPDSEIQNTIRHLLVECSVYEEALNNF